MGNVLLIIVDLKRWLSFECACKTNIWFRISIKLEIYIWLVAWIKHHWHGHDTPQILTNTQDISVLHFWHDKASWRKCLCYKGCKFALAPNYLTTIRKESIGMEDTSKIVFWWLYKLIYEEKKRMEKNQYMIMIYVQFTTTFLPWI